MLCKKFSYSGKLYKAIARKAIRKIFNPNTKTEPRRINEKVFLNVAEKAKIKEANKMITLIALQPSTTLAIYLFEYIIFNEGSNSCLPISTSFPKSVKTFLVCFATNSVIPSTSLF